MPVPPEHKFALLQLLSEYHEANSAQLTAITAVIEHIDTRIKQIEDLLALPFPAERSN